MGTHQPIQTFVSKQRVLMSFPRGLQVLKLSGVWFLVPKQISLAFVPKRMGEPDLTQQKITLNGLKISEKPTWGSEFPKKNAFFGKKKTKNFRFQPVGFSMISNGNNQTHPGQHFFPYLHITFLLFSWPLGRNKKKRKKTHLLPAISGFLVLFE